MTPPIPSLLAACISAGIVSTCVASPAYALDVPVSHLEQATLAVIAPRGAPEAPDAPAIITSDGFSPSSKASRALFQLERYQGTWYEVASMKKGFAGEGQQDCHCTTGIYKMVPGTTNQINVTTFCVHGSPTGRISGLQGSVTCADPAALRLLPEFLTPLERKEGIVEKCVLRFPSLPFIPAETYDIVATDYTSYALVQGSPDQSFIQIYSRTPNPGDAFIQEKKNYLKNLGYDIADIRDTPQDCDRMDAGRIQGMMAAMQASGRGVMEMRFNDAGDLVPLPPPEFGPGSVPAPSAVEAQGIAPNPVNILETLRDLKRLVESSVPGAAGGK